VVIVFQKAFSRKDETRFNLYKEALKKGETKINTSVSNPYDLFEGKNFGIHVRKVGEWNNYDLCQFVGERMPLIIDGNPVEKTEEGRETVTKFLKTGPLDLDKYDYNDWSEEETDKIMRIVRNTIPDGRMVSEIIGASVDSKPFGSPVSVDSLYEEASSR
jgi:hypothetical protein